MSYIWYEASNTKCLVTNINNNNNNDDDDDDDDSDDDDVKIDQAFVKAEIVKENILLLACSSFQNWNGDGNRYPSLFSMDTDSMMPHLRGKTVPMCCDRSLSSNCNNSSGFKTQV